MKLGFGNIFSANGKRDLEVISKLRKIEFFQEFKPNELHEIAGIVYVRWYKKNEVIFQEDKPGIGMYFIDSGSVRIARGSLYNGYQQLSVLSHGDILGEFNLFEERVRTISAVALQESCLLGIFRPDLLGLINRKPRLGNKILLRLAQTFSMNLLNQREQLIKMKETLANSDIIL